MKIKKDMLQMFCFVAMAMLFAGCGGAQKMAKPDVQAGRVGDFDKMREDLDPLSMDDYGIDFEESAEAQTDNWDVFGKTAQASRDTVGNGYRIQLIQTTEPEEAKDVQRDAILRFDEEVYMVFDPPYYKVRIGDFINWNDAETLQELAIRRGFRQAWIVRSQVNLKKAYSRMNQF